MVILVDSDDVIEAGYPTRSHRNRHSQSSETGSSSLRRANHGRQLSGLIEGGIRDVNVFDGHRRGVGLALYSSLALIIFIDGRIKARETFLTVSEVVRGVSFGAKSRF